MRAESSSTDWKYITAKELISEVKQSLRKYADNNLIDDNSLLKHIIRCNEFLGERLHHSRQCKLIVKDNRAPVPSDLWKIEMAFGLSTEKQDIFTGIFGSAIVYHPEELELNPSLNEQIHYLGALSRCKTKCGTCDNCKSVHVSVYDTKYFERVENKRVFPLKLISNSNDCVPYSPCNRIKSGYTIDLMDGEFRFSFPEGEIFLSYLGDLIDGEGNLLIPDNELLLPYYEWTLKNIVLEDLVLNTDLDVINAYKLSQSKLVDAKLTAMDYIGAFKGKQLDQIQQKRKIEFYNKWYAKFDV